MIFRTAFPRSPQVSSPIELFSKFGIARTLMLLSILFNTRVARSFSSSSSYQDRSPTSSSLQNLLKSGFTLTLTDFTRFLLFLSQNRRFKYAIQFFSQMNSNQIEGDSRACSIFTWALLKEHKFDEAERFMKTQMRTRPNFPENCMWDSLIQGLCKNDPEKGLLILRDCLRINGMSPSPLTFCSLIYAFCSRGMMSQAIEALELMNSEKSKYPLDNFVCSSIIAGFCRTGKPEIAVRFYENAESSGAFRPSLVTCTAIVSALCKFGKFDEVSGLARKMENAGLSFDVIFYSCWICGYFREGILVEAFQRYREMVGKAISPDTISYTILIDGLTKYGNVEKAVGFLNKMMKDGLKPNLVTYTAIMSGFCKKGKLEEACAVFRLAEDLGIKVDEFMYATIIDGFSRRGDFGRVYSLLDEMEKKGINPSIVTYNTVINGLCKCGRTSEANEVSKGIPVDIFTYCTLLHGYIKEVNFMGILETKRKMEEAGVRLDVIMCNILVKALFLVGDPEAAYEIYKGFPEINLVADSVTYCTMLDGYCKLSNMDKALEIFDDFRKTSISSIACYRCIIYWFCMKGMLDMATAVFSELTEKGLDLDFSTYKLLIKVIFKGMGVEGVLNLVDRIEYLKEETTDVMFNYAIYFLCKRGFVEAACNVYMVMRIKGSAPTCKSYCSILTGLIGDGKKWLSWLFLGAFLKEFGFTEPKVSKILVRYLCMKDINSAIHFLDNLNKKALPVTFPVSILKMLSNDGRALDAYELVMAEKDRLPVIDVVDYSIIVDGLCKGGHFIKALDLCAFAKKKGITFNIVTYNSVINGLCHQGCLVQALRLFDSFEKIDLVPSEITYATLVDALCKEGYVSEAKKLFERMILKGLNPNTRVYNSLINHYCRINQLEKAWKLLLDLEARCLKPDGFTLSSMINGYCHRGDLEGALEFFYEFKRKDLLPDFLGFVRLMRGLCTKGRMEEARAILREMLAAQSVVELLEKVDFEVEPDSMKSVLVFLCEQGSIQEAITVLNEVGCRFFPVKMRSSSFSGSQKLRHPNESEASGTVDLRSGTSYYEINLESGMHGATKEEIPENYDNLWKKSQNHDFNSRYSIIGLLCSRGELQKANMLVKDMISNLNRGC